MGWRGRKAEMWRSGDAETQKKLQDSQESPLEGPATDFRTYTDSLPLGSSTGAATERAPPVAYGGKLNCLASGRVLGNNFLLDKIPDAMQQPLALF